MRIQTQKSEAKLFGPSALGLKCFEMAFRPNYKSGRY